MSIASIKDSSWPRRMAALVFLFTLAVITTAGDQANDAAVGSPEFWGQMVITIGLGATLSLINAGVTFWMIKYVMSSSDSRQKSGEVREDRLMTLVMNLQNEKTAQRVAFVRALERISPHIGNEDIFDRELGENHRVHGEGKHHEDQRDHQDRDRT